MKNYILLVLLCVGVSCNLTRNSGNAKAPVRVKIETDSGTMILSLSNKTPLHRDNFKKLVKEHFYDGILFHRVIPNFMIQGGDPDSKNAAPGALLGEGGLKYTIKAEFDTSLYHKKGALAMAREGDDVNPQKESSSTQFYIVEGKKYTDEVMDMMEKKLHITIPEAHREIYRTIGGTPFLDMNYTVFGEMESGFDVIGKIANAPRDSSNRPFNDIKMKITLLRR